MPGVGSHPDHTMLSSSSIAPGATLGTTRNRTEIFLKYRNHARGGARPLSPDRTSSTGKLLAAALASHDENGHAVVEVPGIAGIAAVLPPQYVDFKEGIRVEMSAIKRKMDELKNVHSRAALTHFDDANSDEAQIEVLTQEITRLFKKCEVRLTRFGGHSCNNEADEKVRQNVQRVLALELQKLSLAFRKQQKTYLNRLRTKEGAAGSFAALEASAAWRSGGGGDEDYDPGFSELQLVRVDNMDALALERDQEVTNIVASINDLAQVMKDLAVLVIDQGTILDRIDYNIEQVAMQVDEGVKQLVKAEKTQKKNRMIMCIMFLMCAVVLMLVIVVAKAII